MRGAVLSRRFPLGLRLQAMAAAVFLLFSGLAGAPARAPTWGVQRLPKLPTMPSGHLDGVSCVSARWCMAVGDGVVARWTRGRWAIQHALAPRQSLDTALTSVSCASKSMCMAVGSFVRVDRNPAEVGSVTLDLTMLLAERWDGRRWSVLPVPVGVVGNAQLNGVSCPSAAACVAVGSSVAESGVEASAVVERWNGSRWREERLSAPKRSDVELSGVSCPLVDSCVAVGLDSPGYQSPPIIIRSRGASWTVEGVHATGQLQAVSCRSTRFCVAVGTRGSHMLAEVWNGTRWSTRQAPDPKGPFQLYRPPVNALSSVSCSSPSLCVAVGEDDHIPVRPLSERWNGKRWSLHLAPLNNGSLQGISCTAQRRCTAVGYSPAGSMLAMRFTAGHWQRQPSAQLRVGVDTQLSGVSCATASACVAVGELYGVTGGPLVLVGAGPRWSVTSTPAVPGTIGTTLISVSCPSPSRCVAVGSTSVSPFAPAPPVISPHILAPYVGPLVDVWDGNQWQVQFAPRANEYTAQLTDVSCPSLTFCMAVGQSLTAELWNGSAWSDLPTSPGLRFGTLSAVSCTAPISCVAVGAAGTQPLIESWDGARWTIQRTSLVNARLNDISCTRAASCVAVGASSPSSTLERPLAEIWNGVSWRKFSPAGREHGRLNAVACEAASTCTMVGYQYDHNGFVVPLAYAWNGSRLLVEKAPNPAGGYMSPLTDVSCPSTTRCVSIGYTARFTRTIPQPLIEARAP